MAFPTFQTLSRAALLIALAAAPAAVFAQDTTAPADSGTAATGTDTGTATGTDAGTAGTEAAPGTDLSLGQPASDIGKEYTSNTFESWELRCVKTENGKDPCQLYQLLKDAQGTPVAEISIIPLPPGQQAVAGATIVTPLETLLTEQVTLAMDGAEPKRYPFTFCAAIGCISRVGFTAAEVDAFKRGAKATLSIAPMASPANKVVLDISLKGFTAGFDAVSKVAEENAKKE